VTGATYRIDGHGQYRDASQRILKALSATDVDRFAAQELRAPLKPASRLAEPAHQK
jgi:hypothetical protein